ncbi:Crp/Fnr family transcriptional regulator [Chryseobacterium sp. H1D6B]|uniref:Crp/Fnr family transcriptional regulator n=1 Tax=Chryseobacterium sp. H1D6B TaxID=2940588 RepID=UPI0015C920FE|nr:Crp/Fnr family transcriptional regulator [Chryseobacterium sp. H1D6B]
MKIEENILLSSGADIKSYNPKEFIFREEDSPHCYFQIASGTVKINHYNEDGGEFIHNILGEKQSLGDSMLFLDKKYPMNAVALTPCTVFCLPKKTFLNLLDQYPDISKQMNSCLSHHLYFKTLMIQNMASNNPAVRIKGLIDYLKSFHDCDDQFSFQIKLTRQHIADLTGLRVETVIRTLKKMEKENILKIENRHIFY